MVVNNSMVRVYVRTRKAGALPIMSYEAINATIFLCAFRHNVLPPSNDHVPFPLAAHLGREEIQRRMCPTASVVQNAVAPGVTDTKLVITFAQR